MIATSRRMRPWAALVSAFLLALAVWSGGTARAAEPFDCIPLSAETAGHFDGDGDQSQNGSHEAVPHQHAGCTEHFLASVDDGHDALVAPPKGCGAFAGREPRIAGHDPKEQLRPPKA